MPLVRRTPAHQPSWDPTYPTPPHPGGGGGGGGQGMYSNACIVFLCVPR